MSLLHIPNIFYTKYKKSAWHVSCIADSPNIHSLHTNIHNNLLALEWNIVNNLVSVTSIILLTQYFWVQEVHTTRLFFTNIIVKDVMISINNADQNNQRRHDLKELCYWNHHQSNVTSLKWSKKSFIQDPNKNKELNMLKSQIQHNWSLKKEWRIK